MFLLVSLPKILDMNDYLPITIKDNRISNSKEIIHHLSSLFPKEDIRFNVFDDELVIYLNKLDFLVFKNSIEKISQSIDKESGELLNSILKNIESIKSYGIKGKKRLYVNYNSEKKVVNREEKIKERGGYFYAREHNFSSINNEIPENFLNKIVVGDSAEVLKQLPDNCIDLIFTSPPYNFGLNYDNHKDSLQWENYFNKLFVIFKECIRVLKYGGRIAVNVQPLFSDYIPIHHIISNFFIDNKLIWKGEILWEKNHYNCKYTAWGSWKSPSNPYLKYSWEFIEVFCKGDLKHEGDSFMADITPEEFKKWVYAKWDIQPEFNMKKYGHPAMFPEELAERIIKLFSFKQDVVLDPFNGVGTTTSVAKKLSRKFIGIDISEEYCKIAEKRLKNTVINHHLFDEHVKEN